jgi:hypothetical protein
MHGFGLRETSCMRANIHVTPHHTLGLATLARFVDSKTPLVKVFSTVFFLGLVKNLMHDSTPHVALFLQ